MAKTDRYFNFPRRINGAVRAEWHYERSIKEWRAVFLDAQRRTIFVAHDLGSEEAAEAHVHQVVRDLPVDPMLVLVEGLSSQLMQYWWKRRAYIKSLRHWEGRCAAYAKQTEMGYAPSSLGDVQGIERLNVEAAEFHQIGQTLANMWKMVKQAGISAHFIGGEGNDPFAKVEIDGQVYVEGIRLYGAEAEAIRNPQPVEA